MTSGRTPFVRVGSEGHEPARTSRLLDWNVDPQDFPALARSLLGEERAAAALAPHGDEGQPCRYSGCRLMASAAEPRGLCPGHARGAPAPTPAPRARELPPCGCGAPAQTKAGLCRGCYWRARYRERKAGRESGAA